jgi:hypothetical protein
MQSSLARTVQRANATPHEMQRLRERAWREEQTAVFRLADIPDPWERQIVVNIATRLYGKANR